MLVKMNILISICVCVCVNVYSKGNLEIACALDEARVCEDGEEGKGGIGALGGLRAQGSVNNARSRGGAGGGKGGQDMCAQFSVQWSPLAKLLARQA